MGDDCVIVDAKKSPRGSPPLKKLKQSRLPFSPVNLKSPSQSEHSSNEKKRKLSGSDEPQNAPKTPRNENRDAASPIKDENLQTPKENKESGEKTSEKIKTEVVSKKRGRPSGSTSKSKPNALTSPKSDTSPVLKKKGRISKPNLDKSVDCSEDGEGKSTKEIDLSDNDSCSSVSLTEYPELSKESVGVESEVESKVEESNQSLGEGSGESVKKEDYSNETLVNSNKKSSGKKGRPLGSKSKPKSDITTSHNDKEKGSKEELSASGLNNSKDESCLSEEQSNQGSLEGDIEKGKEGSKEAVISEGKRRGRPRRSFTPQTPEHSQSKDGESVGTPMSGEKRGRGRPKKSLSPVTPKDSQTKKRGRPFGSKNKDSNSSLNVSRCSDVESEGGTPVSEKKVPGKEKARQFFALFASPSMTSSAKKENRKLNKSKSSGASNNEDRNNSSSCKLPKEDSNESSSCKLPNEDSNESSSCKLPNEDSNEIQGIERILPDSDSEEKVIKDEEEILREEDTDKKDKENILKEKNTDKKDYEKVMKEEDKNGKDKVKILSEEDKDKKDEGKLLKQEDTDEKDEKILKEEDTDDKISKEEDTDKCVENDKVTEKGNEEETNPSEGTCISKDKKKFDTEDGNSKNSHSDESIVHETSVASSNKEDLDSSTDLDLNDCASAKGASICNSEDNAVTSPVSNTSDVGNSPSVKAKATSTPTTPKPLFSHPKKLTPKQKEKEVAKLKKLEERTKLKQEKEKILQEKQAEKEKLKKQKEEERLKHKEEKEKVKEELRKKRQEELDARKLKKEEELQKKEEERLKKEEERLKKEEERLKKEEEKQKKMEEQQRLEEEKQKQSEKLKNRFASFFVAGKKKEADDETKDSEGPFREFRIKEDMQLAPLVRNRLSKAQYDTLDDYVHGEKQSSISYMKILKSDTYNIGKWVRTWPSKKEGGDNDDDDDDVMILGEEEEDVGNCSDMIQDPSASVKSKTHKAKLLYFCENQRPAYWGTWSKKSTSISARRPFARDDIFDYEYDSDDDWEEEETGESLSDSEGEDKEEKGGEGDQYEVDNDFFVPHGYLSDDEGKSDEEAEGDETEASKSKETEQSKNTEQLKMKQAEFEEEMKQKTKVLKPRVFGCLWMSDKNNNTAYDQLLKILGPHRAVTMCSQLPITSRHSLRETKESIENDADDEGVSESKVVGPNKFVKTFPEEAVPALIKLLHGNCNAKEKLSQEFKEYWCKLTGGELEESKINATPNKVEVTKRVYISRVKVRVKIQEIGSWKRCQDESSSRHVMRWYVPETIREKYGLGDLTLSNSWLYTTNVVKDKKDDLNGEEDTPKVNKIRPITAFTKKIPSTPSSTNTSPNSPAVCNQSKIESKPSLSTPSGGGLNATPKNSATTSHHSTPSSTPEITPTTKQSHSGIKSKKKLNLFPGKSKEVTAPQKGSIASFFSKSKGSSPLGTKVTSDSNDKKPPAVSEDIIILE